MVTMLAIGILWAHGFIEASQTPQATYGIVLATKVYMNIFPS